MKKSIRTIGILLIILSIIFFLVNMGLLHFNYFTLLSNGSSEFSNDAFPQEKVTRINIHASNDVVEFGESEDNQVHFAYINSDKFFFDIVSNDSIVEVNLTDNIVWYDYFAFYIKIPITVYIPKGFDIPIYVNGQLVKNIVYVE